MLFYYIRHGLPTYQPDALTPEGWEQAKALANRFVIHGLDRIYSSSAPRALETAQPTCERLGLEPIVLDWAHEDLTWKEFGEVIIGDNYCWSYKMSETISKFMNPEVLALGKEWYTHPLFANTKMGDGIKRVAHEADQLMLELGYEHDSANNRFLKVGDSPKRVAFFAHSGFGRTFLSHLLDIPYPLYAVRFDGSFTGVTVVEFGDEPGGVYPRVLQLSNDSHLYHEGLSTRYNNQFDL
jgi:probable phosphoglycerate mutase